MKRRLLCLAAFAFVAPMTMLAQTTGVLSGKVTDDEGKPLIGATIRIGGTTQGGIAKAPDGKFLIAGIRAGEYDVTVSSVGYTPQTQKVRISVDQTSTLNIKLSTGAVKGKEIVFTDKRMVRPEKTGTMGTTTSEDLDRSARTSIVGAIQLQAGVTTGGVNGFSIRGGRSTETSIRVDGISISDPFIGGFGSTNASLYPTVSTLAVSEVQTIASGFSAEYGDVLSGVSNSVTKSGRNDKYEGSFRFRTNVGALYGSTDPLTVKITGTDRDTTLPSVKAQSSGNKLYEFAVGGPIPGINDITFFISGKYNTIDHSGASYEVFDISPEYAQQRAGIATALGQPVVQPTNLGILKNNSAMVRDLNAKFKVNLTDNIFVELSGETALTRREIGDWGKLYMLDNPVFNTDAPGRTKINDSTFVDKSYNEGDHQTLNQNTIIQRGILRYFQTLDAGSYFEVTGSYVHNRTEEGRKDVSKSYGPFEAYDIYYPEDKDSDVIIDQYYSPSKDAPAPLTGRSIATYNPLTGFIEGPENAGASYNPYGLNDLGFPAHGAERLLEFRDAETMTLKGAYETNIDIGDVKSRIKAGFDLARYTLRRHYNSLPWDAKPFFDIYGFDATYFSSDTTGKLTAFFSKPYHPLTGALYVSTNFSYKSINLSPGVRFDFFNPNVPIAPAVRPTQLAVVNALDTMGDATLKFQVSPRIGVSYPITEQSQFRVNFAAMFKMPEMNELYDNAYGDTQRGNQEFGNPNIDPQKVFTYEMGYEAQLADDYYIDIAAYYRDIYNQTGISFVQQVPSPYTIFSTQEYGNVRGLSISARRQLADNFKVDLNYTLQQARGTASSPDANYAIVTASADPYTGEQQKFPLAEFPLSYDQTHTLNGTLSLIWGDGEGPAIGGIRLLQNTVLTLTGTFATGLPYTLENTRHEQIGQFNGQRLPSSFSTEGHLEKGFKLKDVLGDAVGNLELSFFADVTNILNSTGPATIRLSRNSSATGGALYSITGSPDYDGTGMNRGIGEFTATPYYRDMVAARSETMSADQYDNYGHRLYNVYADANLDGVVTQLEKYQGYQRYITTVQALRGAYTFPRTVAVGVKVRF
jgi:outer membrane receptor protein involved in Fe transport